MNDLVAAPRSASIERRTAETEITVELNLDGEGHGTIETGLGFLDHMLMALAKHGRFDLQLECEGDLEIDDHHTAEDCALALGMALDQALGDRRGIVRFGHAYAPLDEALARVVVDFSGRPSAHVELDFRRERIGDIATENLTHFFVSLGTTARMTLHVDVLKGTNDHHRAEAAFKALALALRQAVAASGSTEVPSTKGVL
jgi:imidazoleglycerol-phosphate dehydratase